MRLHRVLGLVTVATVLSAGACDCGERPGGSTGGGEIGGGGGSELPPDPPPDPEPRADVTPVPHPDLPAGEGDRTTQPWGDLIGGPRADPIIGHQGAPPSPLHTAYVHGSTAEGVADRPETEVRGRSGDLFRRVGDLDGDDRADLVVGSKARREVHVFLGRRDGFAAEADRTLPNPGGTSSAFGYSVWAADLNGDGHRDLIAGAPTDNGEAGRVFVFAGGPSGIPSSPTTVVQSPGGQGTWFGAAVAACDLDGDGPAELVVGAPRDAGRHGRVYLYRGAPGGVATHPFATLGAPDGSDDPDRSFWEFGALLAAAGDVVERGGCTVLVAATGVSHHGAYVLRAPTGREPELTPLARPDDRVHALAAGDLDGDGHVDAVVGTHGDVRVHLAADGDVAREPTVVLTQPEDASGYFGEDVAVIGDTNGDGRSDLLVAASKFQQRPGSAYLYYGTPDGVHPEPTRFFQAVGDHEDYGIFVE